MSLETRLNKLEAIHAPAQRILVVYQDQDQPDRFRGGRVGSDAERTYTEAELDALGDGVTVVKVVYASMDPERQVINDEH